MGGMDLTRQRNLRPLRYGRLWIGLAPDYRHTAPTTFFVARYPGEDGDDGYLRYETLQRLTQGIVDWP